MIEITGDFWEEAKKDEPRYDALVCTTNMVVKNNGRLVMGAGIARDFRDQFRDLDLQWGQRLSGGQHDNGFMVTPTYISFGGQRLLFFVAFPTKENWKENARIDLISHSALTLERTANILGWSNILMTRPGCGMGGLEWTNVKGKIYNVLDERFRVISK